MFSNVPMGNSSIIGSAKWSMTVTGHYPKEAFASINASKGPDDDDLYSFVRTHILEGIPYVFEQCPLVYDKVRYFIASELKLLHNDIKLTGSAKLGFSLAPDKWLQEYAPETSDMDFYIISEPLFDKLENDFKSWKSDIESGSLLANTERETQIWTDNLLRVPRTIRSGFINPRLISTNYKWSSKCESVCIKLPKEINSYLKPYGFSTTAHRCSLRVYKDRLSAINRIFINVRDAISKGCNKRNKSSFGTNLQLLLSQHNCMF